VLLSQRVVAAGCEKFVLSISQPEAELKFLVKAAADYEPMKIPGDVALRALKDTLAKALLVFRNAMDVHASQTGAKFSNTHTHTPIPCMGLTLMRNSEDHSPYKPRI
jgi:hypothetical protein